MKFKGTYQDLETIVAALGRTIKTSKPNGAMHQVKTEDGVTINLFETGTLQFQGKAETKLHFENDFNSY